VAAAAPLFAGGFWLQFGNAEANPEARSKNAVLVVKPVGCHNPESAKVSGTAEGIVDGKRTSVALTLVPLSEPGTYAVTRSWPKDGNWVLSFSAVSDGRQTGAIALLGPSGFTRKGAQFLPHSPTKDEIALSLATVAKGV
jgi:hypothetical protein